MTTTAVSPRVAIRHYPAAKSETSAAGEGKN